MTPIYPATADDIAYIIKHLSEQNKAERDVLGWSNNDLYRRLAPLLARGHSETVIVDGHPLYVFGVTDGFTWFLCTAAAFAAGLKGIRFARQRVVAVRNAEGKPLICISRSPHPDAARWFKALGFVEKPMRSVDGERMFVYE